MSTCSQILRYRENRREMSDTHGLVYTTPQKKSMEISYTQRWEVLMLIAQYIISYDIEKKSSREWSIS